MAAQQASGSRLPIALHLTQDLLPLVGTGNQRSTQALKVVGTGSGYGPPMPPEGTPLSRLVAATLYNPGHEPTPAEAAQGWTGASSRTEYDGVCIPLTNSNWQERWERMCTITSSATEVDLAARTGTTSALQQDQASKLEAEAWRAGGGFRRNEVNLTRSEEAGSLLVLASEWLELDSPVEGIRFDSELALRQEVVYASYLSLTTIVLPPPRLENREFLTDYARAINGALASSWHINISVRLPIAEYTEAQLANRPGTPAQASSSSVEDHCETWEAWNIIRQICGYSPRLSLTLDLGNPLPANVSLGRWSAEPVKQIFLPCSSFIPNAKGYPVLSKSMQGFLTSLFKFNPTMILTGTARGLHTMGGPAAYAQYVRHLHRRAGPLDPVEQYAQGYMDHLQQPLQPLMDNLEGETYEGFEKDPIKYRQYEEAMYRALLDRPESIPITVFVVGAGRGPLVAGCLRAAERSRRRIVLTAVEKNPSAFVILQERVALEWGSAVRLVFSDMRSFHPREKADIIVSELLGSFGDNELSPECLDGVMRCLQPDGISIPSSYTSYLAPISTSKLHQEVTVPVAAGATSVTDAKPAEQPYVVMFSAYHMLSAQGGRLNSERVQECWTFDHPRPDVVVDEQGLPLTNHHNARSAHLTFHIPRAGVCHGFAGYFEAVLYGDVTLSIHPERAAGDMLSWFPIFFPLMDPMYLPANSEMDVQIWRMVDNVKRKVWFEWSASAFLNTSAVVVRPPVSPSGSGTFVGGQQQQQQQPRLSADTLSPNQQGGNGVWGTANSQRSPKLGGEAFQSAPSPILGSNGTEQHERSYTQMEYGDNSRILISMSKLHNPGGRASFVGL
ncbi:hypothetical protein OIO90_000463 [Microbotryomycetes sp. JL221]|nr:hypothetical protein OIO90_000463 [Microbotryomycetes sp. JL221]